jgi:hypothetical protein
MNECVEEQQTQHYRGKWHGFGPVKDGETLILAVFERTRRQGSKITAETFTNLKGHSESTARRSFVTRSDFVLGIVQPGESTKGSIVGIATARVSDIRALRADIIVGHATVKVRSLCVIDKVERGDIDGHATIGYAEMKGVSQAQIGRVRANIRMDLANEFSEIGSSLQGNQWASRPEVALKRVGAIIRAFCQQLRADRLHERKYPELTQEPLH